METQESNAKTPVPSENGSNLKQSGTPGRDVEDENNLSVTSGQEEEDPVSGDAVAPSSEQATEPAGTAEENVPLPVESEQEIPVTRDNSLSPILEVSRRFMKNLQKLPGKGLPGRRSTPGKPEPGGDRAKVPVSRRLRDWDTRLFVLSTLKRMVDNEHFEELDEEDNRVQFTREALQVRNKMLAEKDRRQHRRPKVEKLLPIVGIAGKKTDEDILQNTREKQRFEKSKQQRGQGVSARAGKALNEALGKVTYIKNPDVVKELPQEPEIKNEEVKEQSINEVEPNAEVKEQSPQKRGFFNFSVKG